MAGTDATIDAETRRLLEARDRGLPWRKWGPYLSERQWGTVREDYSADGNAWAYFTHDQARSRAYRWGEDGLAGFSDDKQRLCLALALWNGVDPILKERLFGLTNAEGNHGEDVKEYYFYLDGTPTHSYMRWLYKYPQRAYPYADLVVTNGRRSRDEMEYELLDTGVFDDDRYFDVEVEWAKIGPEQLVWRITATNRGPEAAPLHLLPTLWFRNTWQHDPAAERPALRAVPGPAGASVVEARHPELGTRWLACAGAPPLLFTENETNAQRIFGTPNPTPWVKDGINDHVLHGRGTVNPERTGTKCAAHVVLDVPAGGRRVVHLSLGETPPADADLAAAVDAAVEARRAEADAFYAAIVPPAVDDDGRLVIRQALAGMLWSKQYYWFDLDRWLDEHRAHPMFQGPVPRARNAEWFHMVNDDVISMPDKWEYPWYAAWDLAFHAVALAPVDVDFAKDQLELMLRTLYLHPSGQLPAYEWNFSDVNPPVHAWAIRFVYLLDKSRRGTGDVEFLKRAFRQMLINFTWWVNRKDPSGRNVFEGGFLGLDNIGVFDRSRPLPTGGYLEQADGTAWMAFYALMMFDLALELLAHDDTYEDVTLKFLEHFLWIAAAMDRVGEAQDELWDEEDGFFYDVLRFPDGHATRLKVRSLVGLLSLAATTVIEGSTVLRFPRLVARARAFVDRHRELMANISDPTRDGVANRRLLGVLNEAKLRRVLARMLDEREFLGPYGIRSVSRHHLEHPYEFVANGETWRVGYEPAESRSGMFGGNSNWRGPVWFPINALLVRALVQLHSFYGESFAIECPTGSGRTMTLFEVAAELTGRLGAMFRRGADGRRPIFGGAEKFQTDPHWRDCLLFYEYVHGDDGAGLGASHQTGWTGLIAPLLMLFGGASGATVAADGVEAMMRPRKG